MLTISSRLVADIRTEMLAALDEFVEVGPGGGTGLDGLGQPDLVVLRQQRVLADVGEIETDEVLFITIDTVFCHSDSSRGERA